jgi:TPP-dependent pyruvate/acetoin dehydrogenase alpha subunit
MVAERISYTQINPAENAVVADFDIPLTRPDVHNVIKLMAVTRLCDKRAWTFAKTTHAGMRTYPVELGQEGFSVALGLALGPLDWVAGPYRLSGMYIARAYKEFGSFQVIRHSWDLWRGNEYGNNFGMYLPRVLPVAVALASQTPDAVGLAMAAKMIGEKSAVVCVLGDGATSQGLFYESMNMAGVWKAPVVFIVCDNKLAISTTKEQQTAAISYAIKGAAAGIGFIADVDGNDVFATRTVIEHALEYAREGNGPALVVANVYRMGPHTNIDAPEQYLPEGWLDEAARHDPYDRLVACAKNHDLITDDELTQILKFAEEIRDRESEAFERMPAPRPEDMFDYLYETLPKQIAYQRERFLSELHTG